MERQAILKMEQVSFCYPSSAKDALDDINFSIYPSEFVVLCGQSGCGKSTLLRHMKKNQIPFGSGKGSIIFQGKNLENMSDRESAEQIGYVGQNPENQIVTDKVWHELAFGLESLGVSREEIRKRTAEIAEYFGISSWFRRSVSTLSGGQKQILNLAAVMVMNPQILILDEPTSQLDPIGAGRFLQTLQRLNQDFGTTIVLSEQRLEEVVPMADRILFLQDGRLIGNATGQQCLRVLQQYKKEHKKEFAVAAAMPVAMQAYGKWLERRDRILGQGEKVPVTVREGKNWLREHLAGEDEYSEKDKSNQEEKPEKTFHWSSKKKKEIVLEAKKIGFAYEKNRQILDAMDLQIERGSFYGILGGNASGKTTALKVLSGVYKPTSGKVKSQGKVIYLAQNPQSIFTEITVQEELAEVFEDYGKEKRNISQEEIEKKVEEMLEFMELTSQRKQNPMDLSGGQQQRLALGKVLLLEPDVLLLDEPSKGLDAAFKKKLSELLLQLREKGITIVMVSHDMEFCARNATHCGLLFDGQIISSSSTREFFRENSFYTTAVQRMTRGVFQDCMLLEDLEKKFAKETKE